MEQDIIEVTIGGNVYKIRQPQGDIDVRDIAAFLDGKIKSLAHTAPTADSLHLTILASLNICLELFTLRHENSKGDRLAEEKIETLLQKIQMTEI